MLRFVIVFSSIEVDRILLDVGGKLPPGYNIKEVPYGETEKAITLWNSKKKAMSTEKMVCNHKFCASRPAHSASLIVRECWKQFLRLGV